MKLADMPPCLEGVEFGINFRITGLTTKLRSALVKICPLANYYVHVRIVLLQQKIDIKKFNYGDAGKEN